MNSSELPIMAQLKAVMLIGMPIFREEIGSMFYPTPPPQQQNKYFMISFTKTPYT